ncbi:MAG: glutamyl-tRNA reductase [Cyclobacteriaceae bacterium]|nr:glutamyl-tRNA reductase [Cyclobacteriaceae bacterium HetDA_MAG_MS6]
MNNHFRTLGISYHSAELDIREQLSFDEDGSKQFLRELRDVLDIQEGLILSTCNRTEIYYASESDLDDKIIALLSFQRSLDKVLLKEVFNHLQGEEAISHLFEVALGLDAKVLGDIQIANQVKKAYQWTADEQMAGPFLHRLMHSVFYANKRVVQETPFRDGAASVAYASVEIVKGFIQNFQNPKILTLGLGEIGGDVAENLKGIKANITVANRTRSKAKVLQETFDYEVLDFDTALQNVHEYDVVISAVFADQPVITKGHFSKKSMSHKLLLDLSVPRSVAPEVEELNGLLLYNIDQIEEKTSVAVEKRKKALPKVRAIVRESIDEFSNWSQEMEVSPIIRKLKLALEEIRKEELTRYLKNADTKEVEMIDKVTKSIIQKVIKLPVLQLKAACKRGEAETLVEVLNDLFNLEKVTEEAD